MSAVLLAALALALGACGDDDRKSAGPQSPTNQRAPDTTVPAPADRGAGALALPAGVPTKPSSDGAPGASRRTIDGWLRALRAGEIPRAAEFFGQPSKVQNGTPVLTLDSRRERVVFNLSFPCGAKVETYGTNGPYTIIDFVLTERRGGDCGGAAGQLARGAIRVKGGRITEWYRLADDPDADPSEPPLTPRPPQIDPGDVDEV